MEHDRTYERPQVTLHWLTAKKLETFAAAATMPVATFAALCVRAGSEQHAHMVEDRAALAAHPCPRCADAFRVNWEGTPDEVANPVHMESKRYKVPLDTEDLARLDALAEAEFTDRPALLTWLVGRGLDSQGTPAGKDAWRELASKLLADGVTFPKRSRPWS
jgi:hypothetical protein